MRLQQWIMDLCAVSVSVWGLVMGGCLTQPKKPNWAVLLPELNQTLRHSKAAGRLCEAHFSHVHQLPRSFYPELLTRGDSWCQSRHIFAGTTLSTRPAFLTFRLTFDCYFHRSRRPPQGGRCCRCSSWRKPSWTCVSSHNLVSPWHHWHVCYLVK